MLHPGLNWNSAYKLLKHCAKTSVRTGLGNSTRTFWSWINFAWNMRLFHDRQFVVARQVTKAWRPSRESLLAIALVQSVVLEYLLPWCVLLFWVTLSHFLYLTWCYSQLIALCQIGWQPTIELGKTRELFQNLWLNLAYLSLSYLNTPCTWKILGLKTAEILIYPS